MNKQELLEEIVKLDIEVSENFPHDDLVDKEVVLTLIDQLDEPETISEEFLRSQSDWVNLCHTGEKVRAVKCDVLRNILVPKVNEEITEEQAWKTIGQAYAVEGKGAIHNAKDIFDSAFEYRGIANTVMFELEQRNDDRSFRDFVLDSIETFVKEPEITEEQVGKWLYEQDMVAVDTILHQELMQGKPEKPAIPSFVANWIDEHALQGSNPLKVYRELEGDFGEGWTDVADAEVYHWINKKPYLFIDALRLGFNVEKEKLYVACFNPKGTSKVLYLYRAENGIRVGDNMWVFNPNDPKYHLTESEIKNRDELFWDFAKEVE